MIGPSAVNEALAAPALAQAAVAHVTDRLAVDHDEDGAAPKRISTNCLRRSSVHTSRPGQPQPRLLLGRRWSARERRAGR